MTIRSELQTRLKAFCDAQIPPLPLVLENTPFTKPQSGAFIECFVSSSGTTNVTVDGTRTRERGVFSVNVWYPTGGGMGNVEAIARGVVAAFPIVPKTGTVSIEQTPSMSRAILDVSGWVICPVTISYRYEGIA